MDAEKELVTQFEPYEKFCKVMLDAYALLTPEGKVLRCNQLLSILTGEKTKQILRLKSLNDLINFKIAQKQVPITEIIKTTAPHRIDEVAGLRESLEELNLILGIFPFFVQEQFIGSFLLIRDVTAETNLQGKYRITAEQSITDKLTGLYNRAYFDQYLPKTIKKLEEDNPENHKVSFIMGDIDHFKKINDNHGHQAGDYIIKEVAALFKQSFRKTDIICRYGGEEFLGILPSTSLEGAVQAAEKLRQSIADKKFIFNNVTIPVTISLGLAQINLGSESSEQVIGRADEALYYSKEHGRNRVSVHKDGKIS